MSDEGATEHPLIEHIKRLPAALRAAYETPKVNAEVRLYTGRLKLQSGSSGIGRCSIAWLPWPQLQFELPRHSLRMFPDVGGTTVQLVDHQVTVDAAITESTTTAGIPPKARKGARRRPRHGLKGSFWAPISFGVDDNLSHLLFHVPNFLAYHGADVRGEGSHAWNGRATCDSPPWRITIDRLENGSDLIDHLTVASGFAVTHVGRLERIDGAAFAVKDARATLRALRWFLTFARGLWVVPMLLVGYDTAGKQVWEEWDCPRALTRWRELEGWFNDHSADGFGAFPGFARRFADPLWGEPVRLALHWYTESNGAAGAIEGSIILTQAAFELLSHVLLVEDRKSLSAGGFGKLPAADKLRGLLVASGVPLPIPAEWPELAKLATPDAPDGPGCLTLIRNALVHADTKNRQRLTNLTVGARHEAWRLGLWYLELVLLRLFDYSGKYSNRLVRDVFKGCEVQAVPWAP